jgi:uracil-DNA glycosylase
MTFSLNKDKVKVSNDHSSLADCLNFENMDVKFENSWKQLLKDEFERPYFGELASFLKAEYSSKQDRIFPKGHQIFRALDLCPVENVKVVILGQDPYPTRGHAHGLCFSVEEDVKPFPKSLTNIFKEIETDIGKPFPSNGSLVRWAEQGVLLLNSVLTVEEGRPESHSRRGWELFTDTLISSLNNERSGIVYILWGAKAQEKASVVDPLRNLILRTVHPSPLSAHRGFFGSKHFSKANEYLLKNDKDPINW